MRATRVSWLLLAAWLFTGGILFAGQFEDPESWEASLFADRFETGDLRAWSGTSHTILDLPPYADQSQIAGLWWPSYLRPVFEGLGS